MCGEGVLSYTGTSPRKLLLGLQQALASHPPPPILHTSVPKDIRRWVFFGNLLEAFCPGIRTCQGWPVGKLCFSPSSSTGLQLEPGSTSQTCPYTGGGSRCRTQGSTEGRWRTETCPRRDTRPAGYWPAHRADRISVPAGPPVPGTDVPPPQREPPPPRAPLPARALAGEPEAEEESPPRQGEPALAPAQHPDAHDDSPTPAGRTSPRSGQRPRALAGNTTSRGAVGSAASIPVCSPWTPATRSAPRGHGVPFP